MNLEVKHKSSRLTVSEAFLLAPREHFVDHFRHPVSGEWVRGSTYPEHREQIRRDMPLAIWANDSVVSTISQPTFVRRCLELLHIEPGQRVFELGTGSGWNAALISLLCAPGVVDTYEIIPELASQARHRLRRLGFDRVRVHTGDAMTIDHPWQYQRGIFTAGAQDVPASLHIAIEVGGRLLFVLRRHVGPDLLLVLIREITHFRAEQMVPCSFVPVTGETKFPKHDVQSMIDLTSKLGPGRQIDKFDDVALVRLERVKEFLQLHDEFRALKRMDGEFAWVTEAGSVLVAKPWTWFEYGPEGAAREVQRCLRCWQEWGNPRVEDLELNVYPRECAPAPRVPRQIHMHRADSVFVWSA